MLWETLERVNRLRQKAMADPEFIRSANAHARALQSQEHEHRAVKKVSQSSAQHSKESKGKDKKAATERSLADIYYQRDFGTNPGETND